MCPHIPPVGTCRQRPCVRQETWRFSGYLRRCPPLPSWYITLHIVSSSMLGLEVKLWNIYQINTTIFPLTSSYQRKRSIFWWARDRPSSTLDKYGSWYFGAIKRLIFLFLWAPCFYFAYRLAFTLWSSLPLAVSQPWRCQRKLRNACPLGCSWTLLQRRWPSIEKSTWLSYGDGSLPKRRLLDF